MAINAVNGHPEQLESSGLSELKQDEAFRLIKQSQGALQFLAVAAINGHPYGLNAISRHLSFLSSDDFFTILKNFPDTFYYIALATTKGYLGPYEALCIPFRKFSIDQIKSMLKKSHSNLSGHIINLASLGSWEGLYILVENIKDSPEYKGILDLEDVGFLD